MKRAFEIVSGIMLGLALVLGGVQAASAAECSEGTKVAEECQGYTYEGCCDGALSLWCDTPTGPTCQIDCAATGSFCAWKATFYGCDTAVSEDPTGTFPYDCASCDPECAAGQFCNDGTCEACACGTKTCGTDQCGVSCGTCTGENEICNADSMCEVCLPKCENKTCGDDGCGGSCGECNAICEGGVCYNTDGCDPAKIVGTAGCPGCACEACVCAEDDFCCSSEWDAQCQAECLYLCNGCGAAESCGDDICVGFENCENCAGDCACEVGQSCYQMTCCTPMCEGKNCGDDGCGGVCGECVAGEICNNGTCEICVPACTGKTCGDDGCGGQCGTCDAGLVCSSGACVEPGQFPAECLGEAEPSGTDCMGTTYEGCCANGKVYWCQDNALFCIDCAGSDAMCGWNEGGSFYGCDAEGLPDPSGANPQSCEGGTCTPACGTHECGGDGCGGQCGTCPAGESCNAAGMCEEAVCVPACTGKTCGDDGCGGSCGTCGANQTCTAGVCEDTTCVPACSGKECGDDGCGGTCGACSEGNVCQNGTCKAPMPTDVVTEDDVPASGDVTETDATIGVDVTTTDGGGSSGGCSTSDQGSNATSLLLAMALAALLFVRRFRS